MATCWPNQVSWYSCSLVIVSGQNLEGGVPELALFPVHLRIESEVGSTV